MNVLDFFIIALIGVMVATGFFLGVSRVTSGIIAMYFAAIVSATFYASIGGSMRGVVKQMNPATSELIAFLFLFLAMTAIFMTLLTHSIKASNLSGRFAILDNVGGAGLGVVIAGITMALAIALTTLLLQVLASTSAGSQGGMLGPVEDQVSASALVPIFLKLLPVLTSSIRPWFPGGLPEILTAAKL